MSNTTPSKYYEANTVTLTHPHTRATTGIHCSKPQVLCRLVFTCSVCVSCAVSCVEFTSALAFPTISSQILEHVPQPDP